MHFVFYKICQIARKGATLILTHTQLAPHHAPLMEWAGKRSLVMILIAISQ